MYGKTAIVEYLQELNQELAALDVIGEVCLYGGAVMCLVYDARPRLKLTQPEQLFSILEKYCPHQRIKPATQYFIEELFER